MTVCANRPPTDPDDPNAVAGFFTGCYEACYLVTKVRACVCGQQVRAGEPEDLEVDKLRDLIAEGMDQAIACRILWGG